MAWLIAAYRFSSLPRTPVPAGIDNAPPCCTPGFTAEIRYQFPDHFRRRASIIQLNFAQGQEPVWIRPACVPHGCENLYHPISGHAEEIGVNRVPVGYLLRVERKDANPERGGFLRDLPSVEATLSLGVAITVAVTNGAFA